MPGSATDSGGWWVYLIACGDNTFYTGISPDPARRLADHEMGRGARYTRGRGPLRLVWQEGPMAHGAALREERRIKRLTHAEKGAMAGDGGTGLFGTG